MLSEAIFPSCQTGFITASTDMPKRGLYSNIAAKKRRIKAGSGEKMNKPGSKKAPSAQAFRDAAKTAKKPKPKGKR